MNKKGFAISIILYSMVFLLISIFYLLLGIVKTRYTVTNNLRNDLMEKFNESNFLYDKIIKLCEDGSINYVKKYDVANGVPIDTPDGSGDKEVCYYTSNNEEEIKALIEERNAAKKNKDYQKADEIRNKLLNMGIMIKDTREGTVYERL